MSLKYLAGPRPRGRLRGARRRRARPRPRRRAAPRRYLVLTEPASCAEVSGSCATRPAPGELPAVGDWVALAARGTRDRHDPRRAPAPDAILAQGRAGAAPRPQVVAANVDVVFLVTLARRRLQRPPPRALPDARVGERRASRSSLLTKADLVRRCRGARSREVPAVALGVPVHAVSSAARGDGPRRGRRRSSARA